MKTIYVILFLNTIALIGAVLSTVEINKVSKIGLSSENRNNIINKKKAYADSTKNIEIMRLEYLKCIKLYESLAKEIETGRNAFLQLIYFFGFIALCNIALIFNEIYKRRKCKKK